MVAQQLEILEHAIDLDFYGGQCGMELDAAAAAEHFLRVGSAAGLDPTPEFSTKFYLERSLDVREQGLNPFLHFLKWGKIEGRLGHPDDRRLEAPDPVCDTLGPAFDLDFYYRNNPRIAENHIHPIRHYAAYGWKMGLDPSAEFSTEYYLRTNADVREKDVNPFYHYLMWGRFEGRPPRDGYSAGGVYDQEARLIMDHVDGDWYRRQYLTADSMVDPVLHYLRYGWRLGYDPSEAFSTSFYLSLDPDLMARNKNPLVHYLDSGRAKGRIPKLPPEFKRLESTDLLTGAAVVSLISALFDSNFYKQCYPDIVRGNLDPLQHYVLAGWREGRDPTPWFSTRFYLEEYPEVRQMSINPLLHYVIWGKNNNFRTSDTVDRGVASKVIPGAQLVRRSDLRTTLLAPAEAESSEALGAEGSPLEGRRPLELHWVVPDFDVGGGGHMTIFRTVKWLELFGHRCVIWVMKPVFGRTIEQMEELLIGRYQVVRARVRMLPMAPRFEGADALIATSWDTANIVNAASTAATKFYFVQDYESYFYPVGALSLAAETTYGYDLACLCASPWLEGLMREKHGRWARAFYLAADESYTAPAVRQINPIPRIAFYARTHTSRRAVELGFIALEILAASGRQFQVDLFGTDEKFPETPFPAINWGVTDPTTLAGIYRDADIGVCFSATNYSLVPQEMMACGLPVVELASASSVVFPAGVVLTAGPEPHDIADKLARLLEAPAEREALAKAAKAWVDGLTWEAAARSVESAIFERLGVPPPDVAVAQAADAPHAPVAPRSPMSARSAASPKASVVIPTYNGGAVFERVLEAVLEQRASWPFEVIVVDSGSRDGTWEYIQKFADRIVARQIPKAEFQHGRTRNQATRLASGEFVAFLTQDALPVDPFWLYNIVTALERYPQAAGAFGRHRAWPAASPFTKRDLANHFKGFDTEKACVSKYMSLQRWREGDLGLKRFLHFYSDNNSCLRKSVWERHPYPEIDYGEDQLWALRIIEAGYQKLYVAKAEVYHSHDYNEVETFERARTEATFFRTHFGYNVGPYDVQESIREANVHDERWGAQNGVDAELIELQKRLNVHKLLGLAAGAVTGVEFKSAF